MSVVGLSWQWVVFGLRLGWVHTLRYISYASLYDRFSYSSLCRSSHFVHTLTGILALAAMQRQPSNIIIFGCLFGCSSPAVQPHPSNISIFMCGVPGVFVCMCVCVCCVFTFLFCDKWLCERARRLLSLGTP